MSGLPSLYDRLEATLCAVILCNSSFSAAGMTGVRQNGKVWGEMQWKGKTRWEFQDRKRGLGIHLNRSTTLTC